MAKWSSKSFHHWLDELNDQQWQADLRWGQSNQNFPITQPDSSSTSGVASALDTSSPLALVNTQQSQTAFHWNLFHHTHHHHAPPPPTSSGGTTDTPPPPAPPPNSPGAVAVTSPNGLTEGSKISASVTDADGVPATVTYQWQELINNSWQNIGAGKDYLIGFNDGGHDIRVTATYADNAGNSEGPQHTVTAVDVDRLGGLTVSSSTGSYVEGAVINTQVTDPDGIGTIDSYQWSSMGTDGVWHDIAGATAASYKLTASDAGKQIDVVAKYTDGQGHHDTAADPFTVAAPPPVTPPSPPPNSPGAVNITSSSNGFVEGATISATVTDADGFTATPIAYQWQESINGVWQNIGTGKDYLIGFNDGGHDIRVTATYIDKAGHSEAPQHIVTAVDVDRLGTLTVSSSTGTFVEGAVISTQVTDPDGVGTIDSYQWSSQDSGGVWHDITGATAASYKLTAIDAGKQIDVVAHYTDGQGHHDTAADPFTVAAAAAPPPTPSSSGFMLGINLSGAEFGSNVPGTFNTDYTYPTHAEIDYYASKGMDVIRLPFLWERVQPTENGALSSTELAHIDDVVNYAASKGLMVDLDVHNYGKGYGSLIGSAQTPDSAFADLWGKLAAHFAGDSNVMFGLMNEPNVQTAAQWEVAANDAIAAIRAAHATQEILVSGTAWDGAWTWISSGNSTAIGSGVVDPLNNFAFEVHQYLDSDGSGSHSNVVSATAGVDRLTAITQWAEATGNKLFLGEFGVASDATSLQALDSMLTYMQAHPNAWQGATYWAGGPWWGNYMYSAEPTGLGTSTVTDKLQMTILDKHTDAIPLSG